MGGIEIKFVIPFVQIEAHNPNVDFKIRVTATEVYMQCIIVAFASLRHWNLDATLQLTTNKPLDKVYEKQLNHLDVSVKIVSYLHNPPMEFGDTFRGCFYLFDAMVAEEENALFIDPDVYCVGPVSIDQLQENVIGALNLNFHDDKIINGISPLEARNIYTEITKLMMPKPHSHYGGEAIYIPHAIKNALLKDIEALWIKNIEAAKKGNPFLTTEEHVISLVLANYQVQNLKDIIVRIWTSIRYTKVEGGIFDMNKTVLWHLPAEKSYGFLTAYKLLQQGKLFGAQKRTFTRNSNAKIFHLKYSRYKKIINRFFALLG